MAEPLFSKHGAIMLNAEYATQTNIIDLNRKIVLLLNHISFHGYLCISYFSRVLTFWYPTHNVTSPLIFYRCCCCDKSSFFCVTQDIFCFLVLIRRAVDILLFANFSGRLTSASLVILKVNFYSAGLYLQKNSLAR